MGDDAAIAPADGPEVLQRVSECLELVDIIARSMKRQMSRADFDDLVAAGREGLLHAARNFDASHGVPFRAYAGLRVRGAMMDGLRSSMHLSRHTYRKLQAMERAESVREALVEEDAANPPPTAEAADARLAEHLSQSAMAMAIGFLTQTSGDALDRVADPAKQPDELAETADLLARIKEAIAERPEAERRLVERYYFDGASFEEAARELGLSKSWVSRLHARAIEGITRALGARPRGPRTG